MKNKKKHKYNIGDNVKFNFFDGSVHVGKIAELTYSGDNWDHIETNYGLPQYTIHVPSTQYSRGYMIYSGMTNERILESNGKLQVKEIDGMIFSSEIDKGEINKTVKEELDGRKKMDTLDQAIERQREFLDGKVKN